MSITREEITIIVEYEDKTHVLSTYSNEYRSLMHLIFDKIYTEDFGDCRGMGRCGTCIIEILNLKHLSDNFDRNELTTLEKLGEMIPNTRLSCQILVDSRVNGLHCKIIPTESLGF